MIGIIFQAPDSLVEVRIDKEQCLFRTGEYGGVFAPIDNIKLNKDGVVKEHQDLKDREDWKTEAIKRFKEHFKEIETETEKTKYVIKELTKLGYVPKYIQKQGHRPMKIK